MKMRKNARLASPSREGMARRVIAGEMSRPEAAASFCAAAKRFGRFRSGPPTARTAH